MDPKQQALRTRKIAQNHERSLLQGGTRCICGWQQITLNPDLAYLEHFITVIEQAVRSGLVSQLTQAEGQARDESADRYYLGMATGMAGAIEIVKPRG